jgi:hypothetical protein
MKIQFYSDPGHGWAAVERDLLIKLNILHRVSGYSYQRGDTVYLEEDCDMAALARALAQNDDTLELEQHHTDDRSPIRNYARFSI